MITSHGSYRNDIRSDVRVLTWMAAFNLAMTAGILFKVFS